MTQSWRASDAIDMLLPSVCWLDEDDELDDKATPKALRVSTSIINAPKYERTRLGAIGAKYGT